MASTTRIEWTDATWNPVTGCSKVSQGCKNCYAERMAKRLAGRSGYPDDEPFRVTLHSDKLDEPLRWRRPRRIFVCSMSDLFHETVPLEFIAAVFGVMAAAQQHTFQVLTKRPQRALQFFHWVDAVAGQGFGTRAERLSRCRGEAIRRGVEGLPIDVHANGADWPLPNVWMGVSVENQQAANERIPHLLRIPAAVRFLSCEPLLGPLNLREIDVPTSGSGSSLPAAPPSWNRYNALTGHVTHLDHKLYGVTTKDYEPVDWVIVGGENGPGARPMHPDWVRSIRDQCADTGVPFFFKQWGAWLPHNGCWDKGHKKALVACDGEVREPFHGWGLDRGRGWQFMVRVGKKAAGALLDGREWRQFPKARVPA